MRVTDHISEPFEIDCDVTVIGLDLDGEMVSFTGYAECFQFGGPMEADADGVYVTSDDTHLIYTFRDAPQLTFRWGDFVKIIKPGDE